MEDLYYLHQDGITEIAHLIFNDDASLSFSCCSKQMKRCLFQRNIFTIRTFHSTNYISKFSHATNLHLYTLNSIDWKYFQNLEKLTIDSLKYKENIQHCSKLTYLHDNRNMSVDEINKYYNLKYLKCNYVKQIENLIYLQSLECSFPETSNIFDFSSLSYLTKLHLRNNYIFRQELNNVIISSALKLKKLRCSNINFLNQIIHGDELIYLFLSGTMNLSFSNVKIIEIMHFESLSNVYIINQTDSYRCLTRLKTDMKNTSVDFSCMISLKFLEISNYERSCEFNLSSLTSLQSMKFEYDTLNDINIINLTNLTYLHFINRMYHAAHHKIKLPRNIISFHFQQETKEPELLNINSHTYIWVYKILIQINQMKSLKIFQVNNVIFSKYKIYPDTFLNTSVTELILYNCKFQYFQHMTNLKTLKLIKMRDMDGIKTSNMVSLKKLTVKECDYFYCPEMTCLELLKMKNMEYGVPLNDLKSLTRLILYTDRLEYNVSIKMLTNLQSLITNNSFAFIGMCGKTFPSSLKDVHLRIAKEDRGDLSKITMKDVNIHFIDSRK